jgi:type IV pilus assembly protein PilW
MKFFHRNMAAMRGFSLVELMVALTIGLIIMAAVSMLFVSSKKTYTAQDSLARLQENARFAMQFLVKDLRLAGYYGCIDEISAETVNNTLNDDDTFPFNAQIPVEGVNNIGGTEASPTGTWYPSADTTMPALAIPETDAIAIRMADASSDIYLTTEMPNTSAVLRPNTISGLSEGDIIMVSDCASADIMQITQLNTTDPHIVHNSGDNDLLPGNSGQQLSKAYSPSTSPDGTRIMKFTTRTYFIRTGSSGNPALFRRDLNGTPVELVDGVERLQILYGKDTDSDGVPNLYLKAGATGTHTLTSENDWSSIVSVRIGILARTVSDKETDVDSGVYDVDGDCATGAALTHACYEFTAPGDRHKRRVFQAAVHLRNL